MERPHRVDRGVAGGGGVRVGHGALRLLGRERRRERREDNRRGRAHLDMIHGSSFVFSARRIAHPSSRRSPRRPTTPPPCRPGPPPPRLPPPPPPPPPPSRLPRRTRR